MASFPKTSAGFAGAAALLALALACREGGPPPPPPGAIPADQAIGTASIHGTATFTGQVPEPQPVGMSSDPVCAPASRGAVREDLLVEPGGGLANVFVHVASGLEAMSFAPPGEPVVLDQDGCRYRPHVAGVQVNQWLELVNSDATLHNVHALPEKNKGFNIGMAAQRMRIRKYFSKPEIMVRFKCDVHAWMSAYVGVVEHPFHAVSDRQGRFEIAGLPAGAYTVRAWHERLGDTEEKVILRDGERKEISFEFKP